MTHFLISAAIDLANLAAARWYGSTLSQEAQERNFVFKRWCSSPWRWTLKAVVSGLFFWMKGHLTDLGHNFRGTGSTLRTSVKLEQQCLIRVQLLDFHIVGFVASEFSWSSKCGSRWHNIWWLPSICTSISSSINWQDAYRNKIGLNMSLALDWTRVDCFRFDRRLTD